MHLPCFSSVHIHHDMYTFLLRCVYSLSHRYPCRKSPSYVSPFTNVSFTLPSRIFSARSPSYFPSNRLVVHDFFFLRLNVAWIFLPAPINDLDLDLDFLALLGTFGRHNIMPFLILSSVGLGTLCVIFLPGSFSFDSSHDVLEVDLFCIAILCFDDILRSTFSSSMVCTYI